MANNFPALDGAGAVFNVASVQQTDNSQSPLHTLTDGTTGHVAISPATSGKQDETKTLIGAVTETAPATDTASSGGNGRLQRIAQRITSLIALIPSALTGSGNFKVSVQESVNLTVGSSALPTGAALDATIVSSNTKLDALVTVDAQVRDNVGDRSEAVAGADTSTSGLNGLFKRYLQRFTTFLALLPASLGQKAMSASLAVVVASDQSTIPVSLASVPSHAVTNAGTFATQAAQSGTWTVQPGNTANTTPWLVKETKAATGTLSNVASSATSVTILASNANRLGATVFNDSTQVLYLMLSSGTASATAYSVQIPAGGYYEVPFGFTAQLTGIWASANGNARVTELT